MLKSPTKLCSEQEKVAAISGNILCLQSLGMMVILAEQNFLRQGSYEVSTGMTQEPLQGVLLCSGLQCRLAPCPLALLLEPGLCPSCSILLTVQP